MKNDYWRQELVKLRKKANLNQTELGKKVGCSQSQISQLETGGRRFTQRALDGVLKYFKLDYVDIFCDPEWVLSPIARKKYPFLNIVLLSAKQSAENDKDIFLISALLSSLEHLQEPEKGEEKQRRRKG